MVSVKFRKMNIYNKIDKIAGFLEDISAVIIIILVYIFVVLPMVILTFIVDRVKYVVARFIKSKR